MHVIKVRNVNDALPQGMFLLREKGYMRDSRAGRVVVMEAPVMTVYDRPKERVLVDPRRDANPFFHLYESLWMLAGRNDVASLSRYVKRMRTYSDDGRTLRGAYGHRWRVHFEHDQLAEVISNLKKNPECRRQVISMWDPCRDPAVSNASKDVPCNTHAYVWVSVDESVNLTVCCRSNDMIWGAYGANAVHFSFLLEYLACGLGRKTGRLYQLSNNFHAYEKVYARAEMIASAMDGTNPYKAEGWEQRAEENMLFVGLHKTFDEDLALLLDEDVVVGLRSAWLRRVAVPVLSAHKHFRDGSGGVVERVEAAQEIVEQLRAQAPDWHLACREWLERRKLAALRAEDDGVSYEQDE